MPTKHIDQKTWEKVQNLTVKAVIATQKPLKEGEILNFLIKKGIKEITEEELKRL